ncbi:MAG: PepSY-associated TM helix domain-containing protein [Nodosilinea sp.]
MSKTAESLGSVSELSPINRFYRTVWRWHFYAGLFVIPFMLLLAITGSIYLFKPQLDSLMYPNLLFVPGQDVTSVLPYSQQLQTVQRAYPNATISNITPSIAPDRSTEVAITTADNELTAFVNPYNGQLLGTRDENQNLQAIIRRFHGELMIGKIGDYLVELAACWGLVLLLTGLYLWLPRNGFSVWGVLLPRLNSTSKRVFWRDLHSVSGFYGAILIAFLILTGLPWSGFWGETFAQVWNRFPPYVFDGTTPQSTQLTGTLNQQGAQIVPWAVEQLPMPHSAHQPGSSAPGQMQPTAIGVDAVIDMARAQGAPAGFSVTLPEGETGVYTVAAYPGDSTQEVTMHIDQYSGKVLADVRWQDYGLVPKAVELGISIHMGKYFGLANQLLMLLACLLLIVLCLSGTVMWWRRRPDGRLGAPVLASYDHWRVPLVMVAIMGIIFPLVGLSLIAVLLLDYLLLSRLPNLKRLLN